jgi:hypothetical protein
MTAQATDLVAFTDPDYNNLRSSINLPNIEPTLEVNLFNVKIRLFFKYLNRIVHMHFYGILIEMIFIV